MNINRNLHSKTALTEFARSFEDPKDTVLSKIVNKIYVACNNVNQEPVDITLQTEENSNSQSETSSSLSAPSSIISEEVVEAASSSNIVEPQIVEYQVDTTLGRTQLNVVKRISNLLAMKDKDLNDYKNTELQKLWMPDSKSRECYDCAAKFNTFRRKHHCRLCGQIFCSKCCNQIVPGKIIKVSGDLRVCNYCSKVVLSYLKSADINADLRSDLQALEDDLSSKFVPETSGSSQFERSLQRKVSIGYQEERLVSNSNPLSNADRKSILQQSNSLKVLYEEMIRTFQAQQHRGSDLINFLINNQNLSNKQQAIAVLNAMLEAGFVAPVITYDNAEAAGVGDSFQVDFSENLFYRLPKIEDIDTESGENINNQAGSADLENDAEDDIIPPSITSESIFSGSKEQELQNSILSTAGSRPLLEAYCNHEELLACQLLHNENIDITWSKTLINLCARIAHTIHPEYCQTESMDVRNFVNIKKISGGTRSECIIIGGVTFTKNVSHKEMRTKIDNPKILLLQCPIAYQRREEKFVTIDSLILQEKEFLKNVTTRILSYAPDVVLVHKNVAGVAQDMLRDAGITLVLDVKLSVFERLSQCLKCDVVTSIDSNIGSPKLGTCKKFYTKSFVDESGFTKTLMVFDIPYSQRGCSLLLRGGNDIELAKVKKVASFLLFARYNFRLELSYLLDVFAEPPAVKNLNETIFESQPSAECDAIAVKQEIRNDHKKEKSLNIESVADFTDPLRAENLTSENSGIEEVKLQVQHPFDNKFRSGLSSTVLSLSPFVTFPLPYLETEIGRKCALRRFFPTELFYSRQWSTETVKIEKVEPIASSLEEAVDVLPPHEFLSMKITAPADSKSIQTAIADFRRSGGCYKKVTAMKKINKKPEVVRQKSSPETVKDVLNIYNHQRLPVLFCSYYFNTKELPTSFCAQPLLLNMYFYVQNDIMVSSQRKIN